MTVQRFSGGRPAYETSARIAANKCAIINPLGRYALGFRTSVSAQFCTWMSRIGFSQLWSGLAASADCAGLAQLLAQAPDGLGLAAHAQDRTLGIGALLQHRAGGEDLPAQFLRRPGKEELGLDEVFLEERDYRLAQPGDVALPLRAHHDTSGVLCAQRRLVPAAFTFSAAMRSLRSTSSRGDSYIHPGRGGQS